MLPPIAVRRCARPTPSGARGPRAPTATPPARAAAMLPLAHPRRATRAPPRRAPPHRPPPPPRTPPPPGNPNAVSSVQQIDPSYHSNKDNEVVVGLERELAPNLAASAAYTWRKSTDLTATQLLSGYYWYSWIGVSRSNYHPGSPVTANGFTAIPYFLDDAGVENATGGLLLTNRPDYHRTFNGVELSL